MDKEFRTPVPPSTWFLVCFMITWSCGAGLFIIGALHGDVHFSSTGTNQPAADDLFGLGIFGLIAAVMVGQGVWYLSKVNRAVIVSPEGLEEVRWCGLRRFTSWFDIRDMRETTSLMGTPHWRIEAASGKIFVPYYLDGCIRLLTVIAQHIGNRATTVALRETSLRLADIDAAARPGVYRNGFYTKGMVTGLALWTGFAVFWCLVVCCVGLFVRQPGVLFLLMIAFGLSGFVIPGSINLRAGLDGLRHERIETTEDGVWETDRRGRRRFHPWAAISRLVTKRGDRNKFRTVLTMEGNFTLNLMSNNLRELLSLLERATELNNGAMPLTSSPPPRSRPSVESCGPGT